MNGRQYYKILLTDIDGILRGKYISEAKFHTICSEGIQFCSVIFGWDSHDKCYDKVKFTGWHTGYNDIKGVIDTSSLRISPIENNTKTYIIYFPNYDVCPRQLLKKTIEKSTKMGYEPIFATEYEWFNFKETSATLNDREFNENKITPLTPGNFGYSILRLAQNNNYFKSILKYMEDYDIEIEGFHTETGPGVTEAALKYCSALEMADRSILFKNGVKEVASKYGITPTFMAKWNSELPGSGCHIHQSLWDCNSVRNNLFSGTVTCMSDTMKQYLAGQLYCLPYILPMFAPNINSYKRLVDGYWAPTRVGWGIENRTATHRVITDTEKGTRIECRVSGADTNPYLAIAASLASGLYGIEHKLELPEKIEGSAYENDKLEVLPNNLLDATLKMRDSKIAKELFGEKFVEHYVETRLWECKQFNNQVTDWERKRYFEII